MAKSSPQAFPPLQLVLACIGLLCASLASAQEAELQSHINSASSLLRQLDEKAGSCFVALNDSQDGLRSCEDFLAAIDGELIGAYLAQCEILKSWRDGFVESAIDSDVDIPDSADNLKLLVGIESNCGENALQKRTQYVVSAFKLLRQQRVPRQQSTAALSRRLAEMEFNALENRERLLLQNSLLRQQSRSGRETGDQINRLENELIRQQIRRQNQ